MPAIAGPSIRVKMARGFEFLVSPPLGTLRWRASYSGRGAAKSWQFARALLLHGTQQPLRILCCREFMSSIKDSVHRLLSDQVDAMGLGGWYQVQEATIFGPPHLKTEFIFKGLRREIHTIKSLEGIDICWVEEAQAVSEASWKALTPTIRKPGSEIWATFNPDLETDPTYQRLVVKKPPRSRVVKTSYLDNPYLPDVLREEAEQMRLEDPDGYANVWGGEPWTRTDAQVLSGRWRQAEFEPGPGWHGPYYGADFGFARDPGTLVRLWIFDRVLYLEHQAGGIGLTLDDTVRAWDKLPGAREHTIRADSARPDTIAELRERGFQVVGAEKGPGTVKDGVEHLRGYREIVIHPRCELAISEARLWRYKTDRLTGDVLPVLVDKHNNTWDAARYGLEPLIKRRFRAGPWYPGMPEPREEKG